MKKILLLSSVIGLIVCTAVLLPQVREMIMNFAARILHKEASTYQSWLQALLGYAMGGICFILFFDYCVFTRSGQALVQNVKQEIKDCLAEIDFRSFFKPVILMSGVYALGILTIIRANVSYLDDLGRAIQGYRGWYGWSRYLSDFASFFVHGGGNITDISPAPQLLAVFILSVSSVLLTYVIGNGKITVVRLLASLPLGLSPYFLECLSFKIDAPYMALSVLASIVPFLFIARKKAFFFASVVSLLIMCTTYQAASGIYPMIAVMLCFLDWNSRRKTVKEIAIFLGTAAFAFGFAMLIFKFFLMKPADYYTSTAMHSLSGFIPGTLNNIKNYALHLYHDFGFVWKTGIVLVLFFFILQSAYRSGYKKTVSVFVSILVLLIAFSLSNGLYMLLQNPMFLPRALAGFGAFLSVISIYVVSGNKRIAMIAVLALNWSLFIFAFSYGNALADQARYAEFRITLLLRDLNALYPDRNKEDMTIQLENSIDYAPTVKNIAKNYPLIERLLPKRLEGDNCWDNCYFSEYFNYSLFKNSNIPDIMTSEKYIDYNSLNLPVVLNTYYHTIQSDGNRILVTLKH